MHLDYIKEFGGSQELFYDIISSKQCPFCFALLQENVCKECGRDYWSSSISRKKLSNIVKSFSFMIEDEKNNAMIIGSNIILYTKVDLLNVPQISFHADIFQEYIELSQSQYQEFHGNDSFTSFVYESLNSKYSEYVVCILDFNTLSIKKVFCFLDAYTNQFTLRAVNKNIFAVQGLENTYLVNLRNLGVWNFFGSQFLYKDMYILVFPAYNYDVKVRTSFLDLKNHKIYDLESLRIERGLKSWDIEAEIDVENNFVMLHDTSIGKSLYIKLDELLISEPVVSTRDNY